MIPIHRRLDATTSSPTSTFSIAARKLGLTSHADGLRTNNDAYPSALRVRLSREEYVTINKRAAEMGLHVNDYVTAAALGLVGAAVGRPVEGGS